MTTKEYFSAAADLLEQKGWCQGSYYRQMHPPEYPTEQYCVSGALKTVILGDTWVGSRELLDELGLCYDALRKALPKGFTSYIEWNDDPGRTKEEVVALLRSLAQ